MLTEPMKQKAEFVARVLLGTMFISACLYKIENPSQFAKIIYGYNLFPEVLINIMAISIPYLELFAGICLVLGIFPRGSALIVNILLFCFIIAISINLARGYEFNCGCFSLSKNSIFESPQMLLIRDIAFLGVGIFILFFKNPRLFCFLEIKS